MAGLVHGRQGIRRFLKVIVSRSNCIFENLAFEEWLFRNHNVAADGELVLLWSNSPTVVIGRHQNPWLEANLPFLERNGISLVRRQSGGGAVYHDSGNLNISFLTEHRYHNRKRNLKFLADILNTRYNVKVESNKRDDLLLQPGNRKFSGTAARIARGQAYHHLTLLVKVDKNIVTNASRSVPAAAIGYLTQEDENISVTSVTNSILSELKKDYKECDITFLSIINDDTVFSGVKKNQQLLRSWEWTFGKTPKFEISFKAGKATVEAGIIRSCSFKTDMINQRLPKVLDEISA
ncbi:unnamed protein product [Enterobius vermicularis]|uniref:BPL/LPL catalytic domain-containing protein n=1 Tax=Enterobius vermicularis TaxID=51028 RepID=A0A0N4V7K3_ENTVE|nr:unnamed protein product [Enterobius vermicularis]